MERLREDMLVRIVADWNETVGEELKLAIEGYRNSDYYSKRHDEAFKNDMNMLLDKIVEQLDKRPDAVLDAVKRARRILDSVTPLRAAS